MSAADDFIKLVKEGKIAEAKVMIDQERVRSKYEPTRIAQGKDGRVRCYHRNTRVELDADGKWKPVKKSKIHTAR